MAAQAGRWWGELRARWRAPATGRRSAATPAAGDGPGRQRAGQGQRRPPAHLPACRRWTRGPRLVLQIGIAGALPADGRVRPGGGRRRRDRHPGGLLRHRQLEPRRAGSRPGARAGRSRWSTASNRGACSRWMARLVTAAARDDRRAAVAREDESALGGAQAGAAPAGAGRARASPLRRSPGVTAEAEELADRWDALAESMEGAAAAHICALYGVPFLEVRGISNLVGDRDRAAWQVRRAVAAASWAARAVVDALDSLPLAREASGRSGRRGR